MDQLKIGQNDYGFNWAFTIKESDSTAVDLTGYTVKINIWRQDDPTSLIVTAGTVVKDSSVAGTCHWTVTDVFDDVDSYYAELELSKASFIESTEKFLVNVKESK